METQDDLLSQLIRFNKQVKLSKRIGEIETEIKWKDKNGIQKSIKRNGYSIDFLKGALKVKEIASEINVLIHYYGIIMTLPYILDDNEIIEEVSLGAGNTGKSFDLTTNKRVAEFKFIHWKGRDTIRQNNTFKDFYYLAEELTYKRKYLYLIDPTRAITFFNGNRALSSVLSKDTHLSERFYKKYKNKYVRVYEYYKDKCDDVEIVDLRNIAPKLWS